MATRPTARRFSIGSAVVCTAIVAALWLALFVDDRKSAEVAIDQARGNASNLSIAFREHITRTVSAIDDVMITIVDDHGRHPGEYRIPDWIEKSPLLRRLAMQVGVAGPDGVIRASSLPVTERVDVSDRPYFRHHFAASATQPYIGVPLVGRLSKKWSVQFSRRLTRPDGTFDGVAIISVDPFQLWKFFDDISLGPNGAAILVGRDGIVRARSARDQRDIGYDLSSTFLFQQLRVAESGTYIARNPLDGIERVVGYSSVPGYPLVVAIGFPTADVLATAHWQRTTNFALGGFGTIVIVLCAWMIVRGANRRRQYEMDLQAQGILRGEKHKLDTALGNMSQGLLLFDADARLVLCNHRYREIYGVSPEVARPGCSLRDLVEHRKTLGTFTGDCEKYCEDILAGVKAGERSSWDFPLADGRMIHSVNTPLPEGGWVATHEDVTERLRSESMLREQKLQIDAALQNMSQGLCMFDADGRIKLFNERYAKMMQLPPESLLGRSLLDLFRYRRRIGEFNGDPEEFFARLKADARAGRSHAKVLKASTGRSLRVVDQPTPDGGWVATIEDITEHVEAQQRIEYLAHHDELTDLPNRTAFNDHLEKSLREAAQQGGQVALLCIDLDRFKEINDVFGHAAGDGLLKELARRLKQAVGAAFVARVGGDEFSVVISHGSQPTVTEELASRLQAMAMEDIGIEGNVVRCGLSIGVAIYPHDGADVAALLANGDAALYRAKRESRGSVRFFEAEMDRQLRERRALQHELRSAIDLNQLVLFYQPQARIDGEVVGFEALIRWRHPVRGLVPPGLFIPLAEDSGLIMEIGEWTLREACREAASWSRPLNVAVNLSPAQFHHGDLPALVHTVLLETGLAPRRLELEITEGVLIGDHSRAVSILGRLKTLGVRVAMDDFGTGYSSLSYLQSFPFDKIKIDRSFIAKLDHGTQSTAIVRAVIGLARGLKLPVVAEGVETLEQLAFLSQEMCDEIQGYLLGRPLPIEDYADVVSGSRRMVEPKVAQAG